MNKVEIYHGSGEKVEFPEILKTKYTKDFSWGFYCTKSIEQAKRWAKKFEKMNDEWLDFIAKCRNGENHEYDIVDGPMADDTIWNFVNDFLNGDISREVFWEYAKFKFPTHQISFHTKRALECLKFERSENINE